VVDWILAVFSSVPAFFFFFFFSELSKLKNYTKPNDTPYRMRTIVK